MQRTGTKQPQAGEEQKSNVVTPGQSSRPTPDVTRVSKPSTGTLLKTMVRVFNPLIMYDAYTFRWLGFDPHEHDNTREQAFTKVTNVGLISALVFTVWASWLDVVATTSFDSYGSSWAEDVKGIASAFLCTGMFFLLFSVINSVLVLLAVNETEDDYQAARLLQRLDLWFTLPSIYFYLGVGCGAFGFLIWFPAAFPIKYAAFNIATGLGIIALNAPYYQFLILCVYDTRVESNLKIPSHPAWLMRLPMLKRLRQNTTNDEATPAKPTVSRCVVPEVNCNEVSPQDPAIKLLATALESIGQGALLPLFIDKGWDHIDALAELQEHHVADIATLKPGHTARFLHRIRHHLVSTPSQEPESS
ncbi:hypothetical protein PHYPSEUDO_005041 [Phytophthora pseudosyringae]|uniref:SAM domain-containing protein n=1 Tax=Phytophthora pseudosyringae TaxID=221518 RepID=A0A8T1VQ53_9STRA|nr:hypothetical protein PHYPSEUDO_005041 [Phytophthora pseudosyringae]